MARQQWMPRGWVALATTVCLGLAGSVAAQDTGVTTVAAPPQPAVPLTAPTPPPGTFMGLPCPPPGPPGPSCPPPPCEGPTDNTQFNIPMYHVGLDYLYWYPRKSSLPALVTRGTTPAATGGVLSDPRTRILLQGTALDDDQVSGFRLTFGIGLDASNEWSFLGTGFGTEQGHKSLGFSRDGTGAELLGRPFFNTATGKEDVQIFTSGPGVGASGTPRTASAGVLVVGENRRFYGGDADLRYDYLCSENHHIHLLAGVKLLFLDESLDFARRTTELATGNLTVQSENLAAKNRFYGGEFGAEWEFRVGPVFFLTKGKLALGVADVNPTFSAGTVTLAPPGPPIIVPGQGLFVSPATAGSSHSGKFAISPELNFRAGFDFNDYVRLSVGYTFIGLTHVARAGDLINRNVDPSTLAVQAPVSDVAREATVQTSTFWIQGFDVSIRFSF